MQDGHRYQLETTKQDTKRSHTVTLRHVRSFASRTFRRCTVNPLGSHFLLLFVIVHMLYVVVNVVSVCCYTYLQNCLREQSSFVSTNERRKYLAGNFHYCKTTSPCPERFFFFIQDTRTAWEHTFLPSRLL